MDEEDGLRNQILKMPTLVVHHNDRTITTTQHKHVHESNLLTKPKLELEKTSWGASKIQPRLDSSDFLSKTNFTSSLSSRLTGSLGSKLTPPRATFGSPAHPASFGFSMLNGTQSFLAAETKPPLFPPPPSATGQFGNLNNKLFPSKPMLNPSAPGISFGKNSLNSSFTSNGLVNGSVFTAPPLFPKNTNITKFGQSPGFSSASQNAGLFGSAPKFGSTSSLGFGASKFGVTNPLAGMGSKFGSNSLTAPPRPRNGELSHEPVFGSREKVRMMLATKEKKTSSAFEQYAGSTSEQTSSNPFADAMRKAKNPSPRRRTDSELFEETSSSYYTESGESDDNSDVSGDLSGFTDEEVEDSKSMNELTEVKDLPEKFVPSALPTLPEENSIPEALGETPLQPWTSPVKVHKSPIKHPSPTKSTASPIPNHITDNLLESSASPQVQVKNAEVHTPEPITRSTRRTSRRSSGTPTHVSSSAPLPHMNGDISSEYKPSNEVSGHIDLEIPSLSLSIPMVLLKEAAPTNKKTRTRAPSGRTRRTLRTPNPYATPLYQPVTPGYPARTPVHPSATPSYQPPSTPAYFTPSTPYHPSATPAYNEPPTPMPILPPPTPVHMPPATPMHLPRPTSPHMPTPAVTPMHTARTPSNTLATHSLHNKYNPKLHAPTKQEMMERLGKKLKPKAKKTRNVCIGPKSFMRKVGRKVQSDTGDDMPRNKNLFYKSDLLSASSGRTDVDAAHRSRFKQNQMYLCYLRQRALDLVISLFPDLRCGGNFRKSSDDVDGLLDYITTCLENRDSSTRCMPSSSSTRKNLQVIVHSNTKACIRKLQRQICKLLKLMLPSLSLEMIEKEGINTLPKLIHKVISENIT